MATGLFSVLRLVPWGEVIRNAPKVAEGAKGLWDKVSGRPAPPPPPVDDKVQGQAKTYAQHMLELKQIRALPKFDTFLNPKFSNEIAS